MSALHLLTVTLSLLTITTAVTGTNITEILSGFPEYSLVNSYLSQTKLADEINSRSTVTLLVLTNGVMSSLAAKHPLSVIKKALSLHILLDYYDQKKLHLLPDGSTLSTTLYQTTGNAPGNEGFVNITDLKGGKVGFGSAVSGSKLDSSYTKQVKQIPYNLSVLEIDAPILAPGILTETKNSDVNITGLLEKAGCKTFASLLITSGVIKVYESAVEKGLTVFAPNDEAFKAEGLPDLSQLTNAALVSLLQFHALTDYVPIGALKTTKVPISTLATNSAGKYDLTVKTSGDEVTLKSGVDSSRIAGTVLDSTPLVIFTVDSVLLPTELFGKSPSPAPAPGPISPNSPTPAIAPGPVDADSPSPNATPPAPPTESPGESPSDSPSSNSADANSDKNAGVHVKAAPALLTAFFSVSATVICSVLLS